MKRYRPGCSDRLCGAVDCSTCFPNQPIEDDPREYDDDQYDGPPADSKGCGHEVING